MVTEHGSMYSSAAYVVLVIAFGTVLHPELKAFYRHGHGSMKNTVSAIDTIAACCFLFLLRCAVSLKSEGSSRPWCEKLRWAAPPGIFVFLVITLSTWANYLSYETFALTAPSELLFVWCLARCCQHEERRRPVAQDLPAVFFTTLGTCCLSFTSSSSHAFDALLAALLCRWCQASMTVALRSCCVHLPKVSVLEIAQLKLMVTSCLCLPYAIITEGVAPWSTIVSSSLWADHSSAMLLIGSVLITIGSLEMSNVSMLGKAVQKRSFRSPLCALLQSTLQPLTSCVLVLLLADSPWQKILGLKQLRGTIDTWKGKQPV
ncbi:unnamed protein product [Durusdinium trenchii]|uniref:Uncharacterized protein n=1 Tax=Durusdinium trenchii TaxID=1381693 RepID=A0ABP0MHW8_9DINO